MNGRMSARLRRQWRWNWERQRLCGPKEPTTDWCWRSILNIQEFVTKKTVEVNKQAERTEEHRCKKRFLTFLYFKIKNAFYKRFLLIKNVEERFQLKLYAAKRHQFLWCLNSNNYLYFSDRQSLQPLLITYVLMTVKIAEYTWDHTVNINVNVFYATFANVFYSCHVFYIFKRFFSFTSTFFTSMRRSWECYEVV